MQSLKSRGLERRHLKELAKSLGTVLDMSKINMNWLTTKDFHYGEKFENIRQVCDRAQKEH